MPPAAVEYRELRPDDSITAITRLLHAAYRPLAEQGFRFLASHQNEEMTSKRLKAGHTLVGVLEEQIVATITAYGPKLDSLCPLYHQPHINYLGQLAVRPDLQGTGIGLHLFAMAEAYCRGRGCRELLLDTAEGAIELRQWYERLGFRVVDTVQWEVTNYRSVIMSKVLE